MRFRLSSHGRYGGIRCWRSRWVDGLLASGGGRASRGGGDESERRGGGRRLVVCGWRAGFTPPFQGGRASVRDASNELLPRPIGAGTCGLGTGERTVDGENDPNLPPKPRPEDPKKAKKEGASLLRPPFPPILGDSREDYTHLCAEGPMTFPQRLRI